MRGTAACLMALHLLACAPSADDSRSSAVADSAGIEIVTHFAIPDRLGGDGRSAVVLGDGTAVLDEIYRVRGGALLADGRVAVANAGTQEILFFSGNGRLSGRAGGEGEGPEEFSNLSWIQAERDGGLVASDPGNGRLVKISADGVITSSRPVLFEPEDFSPDRALVGRGFVIGVAHEGRVLAIPWARVDFTGGEGPLPLRGALRRYEPELTAYAAIDSVVVRTWYEKKQVEGPPIAAILGAPVFLFSANDRWVAYSEGGAYQITVLEDGETAYVVREDRARLVFEPDSVPEGYAAAADSLPAYTDVVVDSEGRLWARPGSPAAAGDVDWRVFSERGRRASLLTLPATSDVLDARGDRVLLLERDELDVERVVVRSVPGSF